MADIGLYWRPIGGYWKCGPKLHVTLALLYKAIAGYHFAISTPK